MSCTQSWFTQPLPDSKVHGANMGPIWGRRDPGGGPHVGPMNFAIWAVYKKMAWCARWLHLLHITFVVAFQLWLVHIYLQYSAYVALLGQTFLTQKPGKSTRPRYVGGLQHSSDRRKVPSAFTELIITGLPRRQVICRKRNFKFTNCTIIRKTLVMVY